MSTSLTLRVAAIRLGVTAWLLVWAAAARADVAPLPDLSRGQARTLMLAALGGLAILGFGLVGLIWLGARITNRYRHGSARFQAQARPAEHDWAQQPLSDPRATEEKRP